MTQPNNGMIAIGLSLEVFVYEKLFGLNGRWVKPWTWNKINLVANVSKEIERAKIDMVLEGIDQMIADYNKSNR